MAQTSRAWIMEVGAGQRAAAGAPHVVEYLLATETLPVPCTPHHCRGLLYWRERMIPVVDLAPLISEGGTAATTSRRAVVIAWQERPGEPLQYGAVLVLAPPGETWVSDDMVGDLAAAPEAFRHFSQSAFLHKDQLIPILDARRLFGRALPAGMLGSATATDRRLYLVETAPAVNESAPSRAVAENMPAWRTHSGEIRLPPTAAPAADTAAQDQYSLAALSAVVIPFSPGKVELREDISRTTLPPESEATAHETTIEESPNASTIVEPETPTLNWSLMRDEAPVSTVEMDAIEMKTLTDADPVPAVTIRNEPPAAGQPRAGTIESFERLHAIKQKTIPLARDNVFQRRVGIVAIVLGVLCAAYLGIAYYLSAGVSFAPATATPKPAARDVAPGGLDPLSVPVTPAQPPK